MRYLFYILLWVIPILSYSQELINAKQLNNARLSTEPIVIEFWAQWNDHNKCQFLSNLNDCRVYRVCIEDNSDLAESYDVKVLPTLVLINKNEIIRSWKGNLLFELDVNKKEVQEVIDSIVISKFK